MKYIGCTFFLGIFLLAPLHVGAAGAEGDSRACSTERDEQCRERCKALSNNPADQKFICNKKVVVTDGNRQCAYACVDRRVNKCEEKERVIFESAVGKTCWGCAGEEKPRMCEVDIPKTEASNREAKESSDLLDSLKEEPGLEGSDGNDDFAGAFNEEDKPKEGEVPVPQRNPLRTPDGKSFEETLEFGRASVEDEHARLREQAELRRAPESMAERMERHGNNPGNLQKTNMYPGVSSSCRHSKSQCYQTPVDGAAANMAQYMRRIDQGYDTPEKLVELMSPSSDGNPTREMTAAVVRETGVCATCRLNPESPRAIIGTVNALTAYEHGRVSRIIPGVGDPNAFTYSQIYGPQLGPQYLTEGYTRALQYRNGTYAPQQSSSLFGTTGSIYSSFTNPPSFASFSSQTFRPSTASAPVRTAESAIRSWLGSWFTSS